MSMSRRRSTLGSSQLADIAAAVTGTKPATLSGLNRRGSQRGSFLADGIALAEQIEKSETVEKLNSALGRSQTVSRLRRTSTMIPTDHAGIDSGLEALVNQYPPCCRPCEKTELGEFILNPADTATRHLRKDEGTDAGNDGAVKGGVVRYGLRDWTQAGFYLVPPGEARDRVLDSALTIILNLQVAVHRKTSLERYCWIVAKSKIEAKAEDVKTLIRNLLRCDHVNILRLYEACEDDTKLYLMYEYFPCLTVQSLLDGAQWPEVEMADMVREISSALGYAAGMSVHHLGLSLYHILLPPQGTRPLKVFGFGLAGALLVEGGDKQFWGPDAAEKFLQFKGGNHVARIEPSRRAIEDSWSLGVIMFTIIAGFPPILGGSDTILQNIFGSKEKRQWAFSPAFEAVDGLAKRMVEALMDPKWEKRLRSEQAVQFEWIKKFRIRSDPRLVHERYVALHSFCSANKAKKLFGRFLVRFLSAEQRIQIYQQFVLLDRKGDGYIDMAELEEASLEVPWLGKASVRFICEWYNVGSTPDTCISLTDFSETMAEEVIDGRALRHAFESLDDDGSEEINAEELYENLKLYDNSLILEEVVEHIQSAESEVNAEEGDAEIEVKDTVTKDANAALDFGEFCRLFPVRMRRLAVLQSRVDSAKSEADSLIKCFNSFEGTALKWIADLQEQADMLDGLAQQVTDRKADGQAVVKSIRKCVTKIAQILGNPPGDPGFDIERERKEHKAAKQKLNMSVVPGQKGNPNVTVAKKKNAKVNKDLEVFQYNNFLQVQAVLENWKELLYEDNVKFKTALMAGGGDATKVDRFMAYEGAESALTKVKDILIWADQQFSEYQAFSNSLSTYENPLPPVSASARGIRGNEDEENEGMMDDENEEDDEAGFVARMSRRFSSLMGG